jgi:hypothetical protein
MIKNIKCSAYNFSHLFALTGVSVTLVFCRQVLTPKNMSRSITVVTQACITGWYFQSTDTERNAHIYNPTQTDWSVT